MNETHPEPLVVYVTSFSIYVGSLKTSIFQTLHSLDQCLTFWIYFLHIHVQRLFFSSETKKKHVATAAVAEMRTESDKGLPIAT